MKKVIIKCISNYSLIDKYHIIIFDKCNNIVFDDFTINREVELFLNKGVYKIIAIPLNIKICIFLSSFIVSNDTNYYSIYFKRDDNSLNITTILVDKNYEKLPIERGMIKLWRDRIQ